MKIPAIAPLLTLLCRAGWRALFLLGMALGASWAQADTVSVTNPPSPWTCPVGVTSITVELWGGGGGGGGINSPQPSGTYGSGGGGGGGAYTVSTVSVTPGNGYSFTVGAAGTAGPSGSGGPGGKGGDTSFPGATTATGGLGGGGVPANSGLGNGTNGPGGTVTGTGNHNGGTGAAGAAGASGYSGGGGGSGSASADGGNASGITGGTAGAGGGAGAVGRTGNNAGNPGNAPGGGGSGACASSPTGNQKGGGLGGAGRVVISYSTVLTASSLSVSGFPNPAAQGVAGSVTVTAKDSNGITVPSYAGTVTLTSSDGAASLPASHTFVSGDNGVYTFTGVTLNTLGTQSITATDAGNSLSGAQAGIVVVLPPSSFYWTNSPSGNWSAAANWTNDLGAVVAPLAAGQTNYALSFNKTGTYSATNDLNSGFLLNQLNFGGTVTLRGNSLAFTNAGGTGPAINQNSSTAVTIANDLALNSGLTLGGSGSGNITLSGVISGAGSLTKTNSGTLILTQTNTTFTGGVILNQGTLAFEVNDALGSNSTLTINGGTLGNPNGKSGNLMNINATVTNVWAGDFTVTGNNARTFNGPVILANGTRTVTGTYGAAGNTCTLVVGAIGDNGNNYGLNLVGNNSGTAGQKFTIIGASTYGGDTTVSGTNPAYPMQLLAGVNNALPSGAGKGNLYVNDNGQLDVRTFSVNINGLNGTALGTVTSSSGGVVGTLTLGNANSNGTFAGVISSSKLNLVKTGSGTQTLSGVNTYTGSTTISNGTLALSGSGAIANSAAISIAPNATLDVSAVTPASYANPAGCKLTFNLNKTGVTLTQGQLAIGAKNLTYDGSLAVTVTGDALANGDSFPLVTKSSGTVSGWFTNVSMPVLAGVAFDTNKLATNGTGVLEVYTFATTPLTISTPSNTAAVITAVKLANHASSMRGTPVAVSATNPTNGTAAVSAGALTYTPNTNYGGSDSFTVTFSDGQGIQTMAVSVTVGNGTNTSPNLVYGPESTNGNFVVRFAGYPGAEYTVETNGVVGPGWTKSGNVTAPTTDTGFGIGVFQISEPVGTGNLFYRTVYPSY